MQLSLILLVEGVFLPSFCFALHTVPVLLLQPSSNQSKASGRKSGDSQRESYITLTDLVGDKKDSKDFWQMAEVLPLLKKFEERIDYSKCDENGPVWKPVRFPSSRRVAPVCNGRRPSGFGFTDSLVCPTCPQLDNHTECELFRDSCNERRVKPEEYLTYCDDKYGKWRTMFVPADYNECRCCDECIFYRELDQSCIQDELHFDIPETMPVSTIDFRAGCNPYLGHPNQELKALRCEKELKRCVPVSLPTYRAPMADAFRRRGGAETLSSLAFPVEVCPSSCRNFRCPKELTNEFKCPKGAFLPEKNTCNCCGHCSRYQQIDEVCALFKSTPDNNNGTHETEVEEEFIEPGCDHGLVCRFGVCQDIHIVQPKTEARRASKVKPYEPCRKELRQFKMKYGQDGHLHYNAPQCTPLWLYAPVQCRRFVCHCAMEDGTIIAGTKTPRVEVSNMNCDCAREKCRSGRVELECDGYGNYKETKFVEDRGEKNEYQGVIQGVVARVTQAADSDSSAKNELWDVNYR